MPDIAKIVNRCIPSITSMANELLASPELGFFEYKSSDIVRRYWEALGLKVEGPFGRTGLRAVIQGAGKGPCIALIGELDAIGSPSNPYAGKDGVAHACGHFIQSTQVYGAACALMELKSELCGSVVLMAVPAEEFVQIQERLDLKAQGSIAFLSGKPQALLEGAFDGVDMAAMIHAQPCCPDYKLFLEGTNLGFCAKNISFIGKAAHGAEPFEGRNALQAASLFLNGVNANRETFRDDESIRIHPIITKGGSVVNSVPDDVKVETYVRGSSQKAIEKGCAVVDRCALAAAMMMGCQARIQSIPGYLPLKQDVNLSQAMQAVARDVLGQDGIGFGVDSVGSSDIGDLSHLMPVIQPTMGGFEGDLHSAAFKCLDIPRSCYLGSCLLAGLAYEVLSDGGKIGKHIVESYRARLDRQQYFDYLNNKNKE